MLLSAACRTDPDWGTDVEVPSDLPEDDGSGGTRPSGSASRSGSGSRSDSGSGSKSGSGSGSDAGSGSDSNAGSAGSESEPNPDVSCDGQRVTWDELQSAQIRPGAAISLEATATSPKFLLSHAKSGSCLWGAFVGAEPLADQPRGVLLVSYGDPAPDDQQCAPGTDGLPDALAPGDVLRVTGRFSPYAPSACENIVPSPQVRVDAACPVVVTGERAPVTPVTLSHDVADAIARGTDAALIRHYAGSLVRMEGVSALRAEDGEGVVAPYGVLRFGETQLEAHNDVEYAAVGSAKRPLTFPYPSAFTAVTGLVHLDYCTWSLAPRDRCRDFQPPSADCPR